MLKHIRINIVNIKTIISRTQLALFNSIFTFKYLLRDGAIHKVNKVLYIPDFSTVLQLQGVMVECIGDQLSIEVLVAEVTIGVEHDQRHAEHRQRYYEIAEA